MNDAFGRPQSVVVLGGTSDIAGAALDMLVADRCRQVVLAGRDGVALEVAAARLRAGGAERVETIVFDAAELDDVGAVVGRSFAALDDQVDLVLVAVGALGEQATDEVDPARVVERIGVNFTWPAAAMTAVANRLRAGGHGRIVVISSVAGVRVRRANYLYGSTKAGLDGFAAGPRRSPARFRGAAAHRPPGLRVHQDDCRSAAGTVRHRAGCCGIGHAERHRAGRAGHLGPVGPPPRRHRGPTPAAGGLATTPDLTANGAVIAHHRRGRSPPY